MRRLRRYAPWTDPFAANTLDQRAAHRFPPESLRYQSIQTLPHDILLV